MGRFKTLLAVAALVAGNIAAGAAAAHALEVHTGYVEVGTAAGDPVLLHYAYALPDADKHGPGPYPTVVLYGGYGNAAGCCWDNAFRGAGYATVFFTLRGSGCSGGTWELFAPQQARDGVDLLQWVHEQEWSHDGAIALLGESYGAIMGLLVAQQDGVEEYLDAVVAPHPMVDLYRDVLYPGGIPNVGVPAAFTVVQNGFSAWYAAGQVDETCAAHLAARPSAAPNQAPVFAASHEWDDTAMRERSPLYGVEQIEVPVFTAIAWQDDTLSSRPIDLLTRLDVPYQAIVSNGHHQLFNGAVAEAIEFLDLHLKGEGRPPASPITVWWESRYAPFPTFVDPSWETGLGAWPPPQAKVERLSLSSGGRLVEGVGEEATPDVYLAGAPGQSEVSETPATGGAQAQGPNSWTARPAPGTSLSYTTEPFVRDLTVLGTASLDLWLSSTAPDTDLQVTVTEVRPNGEEVFVQHGWLRASHRALDEELSTPTRPYHTHQEDDREDLPIGEATPLRVEILPFGHVFRAGSQLRVWIESPKVGPDVFAFGRSPYPSLNRVHHDVAHRSELVLSVVPGRSASADPPTCAQPAIRQPCR